MRAAFADRSILKARPRQLEEFLAATVCAVDDDAGVSAHVHEMGEAIRQLIANRRADALGKPSPVALFALFVMAFALLWCGGQAYYARQQNSPNESLSDLAEQATASDFRTSVTIAELANNSPSLRSGTVQAWWAGEQARQVQRLEFEAKRQALAGDLDGAARTASRADEIRNGINALADFEKPHTR